MTDEGRTQIANSFSNKFDETAIQSVCIAAASEVEVLDWKIQNPQDIENPVVCAPLVSVEKIRRQYNEGPGRSVSIYPICFSPRVCSMQSANIPHIYRRCSDPVLREIRAGNHQNNSIRFISFQIYNTLKQTIRPHPKTFEGRRGVLTASTCPAVRRGHHNQRVHQQREKAKMDAGEPFRQIIDGSIEAINNGKFRARYEPLFQVTWDELDPGNQNFDYLVSSIISPLLRIFDRFSYPITQATLEVFPLRVDEYGL